MGASTAQDAPSATENSDAALDATTAAELLKSLQSGQAEPQAPVAAPVSTPVGQASARTPLAAPTPQEVVSPGAPAPVEAAAPQGASADAAVIEAAAAPAAPAPRPTVAVRNSENTLLTCPTFIVEQAVVSEPESGWSAPVMATQVHLAKAEVFAGALGDTSTPLNTGQVWPDRDTTLTRWRLNAEAAPYWAQCMYRDGNAVLIAAVPEAATVCELTAPTPPVRRTAPASVFLCRGEAP